MSCHSNGFRTLQYSAIELRSLSFVHRLNPTTYHCLKDLGILKSNIPTLRGKRGGRRKRRVWDDNSGVNASNLVSVTIKPQQRVNIQHSTVIGCVNSRSIRNKVDAFIDHVIDHSLDICAITETWLKVDDDLIRNSLNLEGFCFRDHCRGNWTGGGTGLLFKDVFTLVDSNSEEKMSFEFSDWHLSYRNFRLRVIVVYRPPYSASHPVSFTTFLSEFSDLLENVVPGPHNLIILGDFNIHVDDQCDPSTLRFTDLLDSFDLENKVSSATHTSGHTLDLVITGSNSRIDVTSVLADCHTAISVVLFAINTS
ncbi:hypothetical protein HOLleu_44756 [Holothuria leucospilota]|uniref:Endonuclease/exonuclease/phosphatase domain-containing protein n=1 Tax=Holothuria leucospilota TaxID=206669 RepID=A0A9Q1BA12_HOLLE|nr:hypothetical protein HOLleu_44756 [Holothuria leucospilota]